VVCSMSQLAVMLQDIITMRTEEIEGLTANQGGSVAQHCLGIWSGKACGAWEIVRQDPPGGGGGGMKNRAAKASVGIGLERGHLYWRCLSRDRS
jgi:hypothetical protein